MNWNTYGRIFRDGHSFCLVWLTQGQSINSFCKWETQHLKINTSVKAHEKEEPIKKIH